MGVGCTQDSIRFLNLSALLSFHNKRQINVYFLMFDEISGGVLGWLAQTKPTSTSFRIPCLVMRMLGVDVEETFAANLSLSRPNLTLLLLNAEKTALIVFTAVQTALKTSPNVP